MDEDPVAQGGAAAEALAAGMAAAAAMGFPGGTTRMRDEVLELTFPIMIVRRRGPPSASPPSPSMLAPETEGQEGGAAAAAPASNMLGPDAEMRIIVETMAGDIAAAREHAREQALANAFQLPLSPHQQRRPASATPSSSRSTPAPTDTPPPVPPAGLGFGVDPRSPSSGSASAPAPMSRLSPGFAEIMAHLVGMHAGPAPQPSWAYNEWHRLMEMTMADTGGVKKVASEEGLDQVKRWTFRQEEGGAESADQEGAKSPPLTCAITQMPFEDGDEVAEMPCGHKFDADSLMRWLQRESAACPVCRHELPSREVARSPADYDSDSSVEGSPGGPAPPPPPGFGDGEAPNVLQPLLPQGLPPGVQDVPARLLLMGGPGGRGFLSTRQRLEDQALQQAAEQERQIEDDQIEAAILASVMRESLSDQ